MKIAVTGHTGRVGRLLVSDYGAYPLSFDITKEDDVKSTLDEVRPDVVIHLAGISNVDYCQHPANLDRVVSVNFNGSVNVIRACNERSIGCVFVSSEQVFSGRSFLWWGGGPYKESDMPTRNVPNVYALSKVAVEAVRHSFSYMKVVRSSYMFTYPRLIDELERHKDFPTFIRRSYIYLPHFVKNLHMFASNIGKMPDVLHLAGSKTISQYDLMKELVKRFKLDAKITRRTQEYTEGTFAPRPHKSGLDVSLSAALGFPQYSYLDGMEQMEKDNAG